MSLFYLGLNPRWNWWHWLPDGLNVMYSAGGFWSGTNWRRNGWIPGAGSRWLDSGGFTLLNKYGDYPFSIMAYLNLVARLRPHYYATMDYPCEPEISRSLGLLSNRERIDATVKSAVITLDSADMVGGRSLPVPVIQGYKLDEYKYCIDELYNAGAIRPYMAVGSMCRRLSGLEIEKLLIGIYDYAMLAGAHRLHWFGLKLDKRLDPLSFAIWSRDSATLLDDYGSRNKAVENRYPKTQAERKARVNNYLFHLDNMGLSYR